MMSNLISLLDNKNINVGFVNSSNHHNISKIHVLLKGINDLASYIHHHRDSKNNIVVDI